MVKVKIKEKECAGCGICAQICSEAFEMVDGKCKLKNENAKCIKEAADACPMNVILIEN